MTALALGACSPAATATPTQAVDAIYTAAAQTIEAQAALATATPQPSETPKPTLTGTATLTAAATTPPTSSALQNYCDNSVYISDVTFPDHTQVPAGQAFEKTWLIQNTGTCTWTTGYTIVFVAGEMMGGNTRAITESVAPKQQINVTVKLNAPNTPGSYTGNWRMANGKGEKFGTYLSVVIDVPGGATATVTATVPAAGATSTATVTAPAPTVTPTATATNTPTL